MVRDCRFFSSRRGCNNGDHCSFRHQRQDPELTTAAFFSAATTTKASTSSIKHEYPSTSSSDFANLECWPSLKETIRPIKRDHPATTSNGTPSPEILREDVDAHIENVDVSEASATNETIPPIRQEHPATTSSVTPSQEGLITEELPSVPAKPTQDSSKEVASSRNIDGSPLDDDDSSRKDVDAHLRNIDAHLRNVDALLRSVDALLRNVDALLRNVEALLRNVDASATNETVPPIKHEHPATTSNDTHPHSQDSANTDGSLQKGLRAEALSYVPKAMRGEEGETSTAAAASLPASPEAPAREDFDAQDDGILPDDEAPAREDFDAQDDGILPDDEAPPREDYDAWYPQDDGILPDDEAASREDFDAMEQKALRS